MAPGPSWVLLCRMVDFYDGVVPTVGATKDGEGYAGEAAAVRGPSRDPSPREVLEAMKPCATIVAPPEVSHLYMMIQTPTQQLEELAHGADISSTDKDIVVLYSGHYRPGSGTGDFSGSECYLVYDASNSALSAIPPIPHSPNSICLGRSAIALRHGGAVGEYTLVDIVTTFTVKACDPRPYLLPNYCPELPEVKICVWSPPSTVKPDGEWIQTPIRLPLPAYLCGSYHFFQIDMTFPFAGCICWVDLLYGILLCDLSSPQQPKLSFIPLPLGYSLNIPHTNRLAMHPEVFRSMGCICGAIKFVALVDYNSDDCPANEVTLKTWTLSADFKEWKEDQALRVGDIWASESFKEMGLPNIALMCPVLSMNEDDVIYAILNDLDEVDKFDEWGYKAGVELSPKGHYMIRHDVRQNKVLSSTKISEVSLSWLMPIFFASELSAYLQGPNDHQEQA